jgi:hypothetical protein
MNAALVWCGTDEHKGEMSVEFTTTKMVYKHYHKSYQGQNPIIFHSCFGHYFLQVL